MISSRVALLAAFGVGCLSTALLFGVWRADSGEQGNATSKPRPRSAHVVTASLVAPNVAPPVEASDDSARAVARAEPTDHVDAVKAEPAPAAEAAPPGGSAVSDVLTDLEAAYRQRLIAAARAEAAARDETTAPPDRSAPPPTSPPQVEPPREVVAQAVVPVAAPVAPPPAPAPAAPPVEAPPSVVVDVPPTAAIVAQNDARPVDVHIGDVNQNTYITNVRQGDVYVIQQQLAMLNYMAGAAAYPGVAHAPHAHGVVPHQPQQSGFRQFPSTLTNLDNPWGFNFAPPNLVH
ncbi:MAG TPA: hypothetical protein VER96_40295 [Polyangiaceae bacterium]|nr:hypothetical protein [Polyangiaceae bacterium]